MVTASSEAPNVISTSRHILQGAVDLLARTWNGNLSGISRVVADDAYELRITLPDGFKISSVELSPEDQTAGVTVTQSESPGLARVTLHPQTSRDVKWIIHF